MEALVEPWKNLKVNEEDDLATPGAVDEGNKTPVHLNLCLVGKIRSSKNSHSAARENSFILPWPPELGLAIREVGKNLFTFQFFDYGDMQFVLDRGPWCFADVLLPNLAGGNIWISETHFTLAPLGIVARTVSALLFVVTICSPELCSAIRSPSRSESELFRFSEAPDYRNGVGCPMTASKDFVSVCDPSLVHVAVTLDSEYLRGSIAAVHSVLMYANCPENVFFHFVAAEFDSVSPRVLSQLVRSTFPSLSFKIYIFREDKVINLISSCVRIALENPLNYARNYLRFSRPEQARDFAWLGKLKDTAFETRNIEDLTSMGTVTFEECTTDTIPKRSPPNAEAKFSHFSPVQSQNRPTTKQIHLEANLHSHYAATGFNEDIETEVAQSNTPTAHALRAWAWSNGRSGGIGFWWRWGSLSRMYFSLRHILVEVPVDVVCFVAIRWVSILLLDSGKSDRDLLPHCCSESIDPSVNSCTSKQRNLKGGRTEALDATGEILCLWGKDGYLIFLVLYLFYDIYLYLYCDIYLYLYYYIYCNRRIFV